jgi:hypothetical protein
LFASPARGDGGSRRWVGHSLFSSEVG